MDWRRGNRMVGKLVRNNSTNKYKVMLFAFFCREAGKEGINMKDVLEVLIQLARLHK